MTWKYVNKILRIITDHEDTKSHVIYRTTTAERAINSHLDKMACLVGVSQPISPSHPSTCSVG